MHVIEPTVEPVLAATGIERPSPIKTRDEAIYFAFIFTYFSLQQFLSFLSILLNILLNVVAFCSKFSYKIISIFW